MKKDYSKPAITFESFKLSTSIAGSCHYTANMADDASCGYQIGNKVIFVQEATGCVYDAQDGAYDACYHVPIADISVFAS